MTLSFITVAVKINKHSCNSECRYKIHPTIVDGKFREVELEGQHLELRQQLSQCKWRMAASLPSPWNQATCCISREEMCSYEVGNFLNLT